METYDIVFTAFVRTCINMVFQRIWHEYAPPGLEHMSNIISPGCGCVDKAWDGVGKAWDGVGDIKEGKRVRGGVSCSRIGSIHQARGER